MKHEDEIVSLLNSPTSKYRSSTGLDLSFGVLNDSNFPLLSEPNETHSDAFLRHLEEEELQEQMQLHGTCALDVAYQWKRPENFSLSKTPPLLERRQQTLFTASNHARHAIPGNQEMEDTKMSALDLDTTRAEDAKKSNRVIKSLKGFDKTKKWSNTARLRMKGLLETIKHLEHTLHERDMKMHELQEETKKLKGVIRRTKCAKVYKETRVVVDRPSSIAYRKSESKLQDQIEKLLEQVEYYKTKENARRRQNAVLLNKTRNLEKVCKTRGHTIALQERDISQLTKTIQKQKRKLKKVLPPNGELRKLPNTDQLTEELHQLVQAQAKVMQNSKSFRKSFHKPEKIQTDDDAWRSSTTNRLLHTNNSPKSIASPVRSPSESEDDTHIVGHDVKNSLEKNSTRNNIQQDQTPPSENRMMSETADSHESDTPFGTLAHESESDIESDSSHPKLQMDKPTNTDDISSISQDRESRIRAMYNRVYGQKKCSTEE